MQNTYDEWYAGEGMVLQSGLLCAAAGRTSAVFFNGLSLKNQASGAESETALTWKRAQPEYTEPGPPDVLTSREACLTSLQAFFYVHTNHLNMVSPKK